MNFARVSFNPFRRKVHAFVRKTFPFVLATEEDQKQASASKMSSAVLPSDKKNELLEGQDQGNELDGKNKKNKQEQKEQKEEKEEKAKKASTERFSPLDADCEKRFQLTGEELENFFHPKRLLEWREQASSLHDTVKWNGSILMLGHILSAMPMLLEYATIEEVHDVCTLHDRWQRIQRLVRGKILGQEHTWIELPFRFDAQRSFIGERLYPKGRLLYFAISFLIVQGREDDWDLHVQMHFLPRSPKLKLLIMPTIEHHLARLRLILELFSKQEAILMETLADLFSGSIDGYRVHLAVVSQWEKYFAPAAAQIRERSPTTYHDFLKPRASQHMLAVEEQTWKELEKAFAYKWETFGAAATTPVPPTHSVIPTEQRAQILSFFAMLPKVLKDNLCPMTLRGVLKIPERTMLTFFAEGIERGFFSLSKRSQCPHCHTLCIVATRRKEDAALMTCPFCKYAWTLTGQTLHFVMGMGTGEEFMQLSPRVSSEKARIDPLPLAECLETSAAEKIIFQEVIPASLEWCHVFLLAPGDYCLVTTKGREGLYFSISPDETLTHEAEIFKLPLIRTENGDLIPIIPAGAASAKTGSKKDETLIFPSCRLQITIENNTDEELGEDVIRLLHLPCEKSSPESIRSDETRGARARAPRSSPHAFSPLSESRTQEKSVPTLRSSFSPELRSTRLTLECFFPYLYRYAPKTLNKLLHEYFFAYRFHFADLPLVLYEQEPVSAQKNGKKHGVEAEDEKKYLCGETSQHLLKQLTTPWGVSIFPGFSQQWLCLMPGKEDAIKATLKAFDASMLSGEEGGVLQTPLKLALLSGPGEVFEERIDGYTDVRVDPENYLALPWECKRITGRTFRTLCDVLAAVSAPALVISATLIASPLIAAWLREHRMYVKKLSWGDRNKERRQGEHGQDLEEDIFVLTPAHEAEAKSP